MKRLFAGFFILIWNLAGIPVPGQHLNETIFSDNTGTPVSPPSAFYFIENKGQMADENGKAVKEILFKLTLSNMDVYFFQDKISYVLKSEEYLKKTPFFTKYYKFDLEFINSSMSKNIRAEEEIKEYFNFYYPHCPEGIKGVKGYAKLIYENIYPGIDLKFYINAERGLEYDFVIRPGASPDNIQLKYTEDIQFIESNALTLNTPFGLFKECIPVSYQMNNRDTIRVEADYNLNNDLITFSVNNYDPTKTLVIDPWATYYGGTMYDFSYGIATRNGSTAVVGITRGNIPVGATPGNVLYQGASGGDWDVFVVKFDNSGNRVWASFYGGSQRETAFSAQGVTIDPTGNIIITGVTESSLTNNFPVGASAGNILFQATYGGVRDAFIVKFDATGNRVWGTYYGSTDLDEGYGVCTDSNGDIFVTGLTRSTGFPVLGGYSSSCNNCPARTDAFVSKFSSLGALLWGTFLGGSDDEFAYGVTTDINNDVILTGSTKSSNFPVLTPIQSAKSTVEDVFVTKIPNGGGVSLIWSTYYGFGGIDIGRGVSTDNIGNVVVTGYTTSNGFSAAAAGYSISQSALGGGNDAFLLKLGPNGTGPFFSTYLGGAGLDRGWSVDCDADNNIIVTGQTASAGLAFSGAAQSTYGGANDAFVTKYDPFGNKLCFTYLGGSGSDEGRGISISSIGDIYVSGETQSSNFPVQSAFQNAYGGLTDAFVTQICPSCGPPRIKIAGAGGIIYPGDTLRLCEGDSISFKAGFYFGNTLKYNITGTTFSWNTVPAATTDSVRVRAGDTLTLIVEGFLGSCSDKDTIVVIGIGPVKITASDGTLFSNDQLELCYSDSVVLKAGFNFAGTIRHNVTGASFIWNTLPPSTADSVVIKLSPSKKYIVTATLNGCVSGDTITIKSLLPGLPFISGEDTICIGSSDTLVAGSIFPTTAFQWFRDTSGVMIAVNDTLFTGTLAEPDTFYVRRDSSGCKSFFEMFKIDIKSCAVVPLTLLFFNGSVVDNLDAFLEWTALGIEAGSYFVVEKNSGQGNFTDLARINVSGTESMQKYSYTDRNIQGTNYYRLRSVDPKGKIAFSGIVSLKPAEALSLFIYPNPLSLGSDIKILLRTQESSFASFAVFNVTGQNVGTGVINCRKGINEVSISASGLGKGYYFIEVSAGGEVKREKILIH